MSNVLSIPNPLSLSSGHFSSSYEDPVAYFRQGDAIEESDDVEFSEMNEGDENGNNALTFAVCQGREDLAEDLIDQGSFLDHQNNNGETALYWAASEGNESLVELLLVNGANPNICTLNGAYPLHIASANGHLKVIAKLVAYGAFVNAQDEEMDSPLHYAVRECRPDVVDLLVTSCRAKTDIQNVDMESPADLAECLVSSEQREYELIAKFLKQQRQPTNNLGGFNQVQAHLVY